MKKNGFISSSMIYIFFIVFLSLMLFLMNSYVNTRYLIEEIKYDIRNSFASIDDKGDANIYFLLENVSGKYEIVKKLPQTGYSFNSELSYCKKGSQINYTNGMVSITTSKKDICYAYFDKAPTDLKINIYLINASGRNKVDYIPNASYELVSKNCVNAQGNSYSSDDVIKFDEETREFVINFQERLECTAEFRKKEPDTTITIYTKSQNEYVITSDVPEGYNLTSFICDNASTIVTFDEETRELGITSSEKDNCKVYFG